jgi:arginase
MDVSLIEVPYHAGDESVGASEGPRRLLEARADAAVVAHGVDVTVERVDRGEPFRDTAVSSAAVNKALAGRVRAAVAASRLPVVLAGSCNSALGVLAGLDHSRCGAVWLDAHGDFNTPETTVSGFFAGMSMAIVTGHCYRDYWAQVGDATPLAEDTVVMYGVRALSPEAERERLEGSAIEVVSWREGRPETDVVAPLDRLSQRVDDIYLHLDFDAFAPEVAPGVVDEPVAGGLSVEQAELIIRAAADRFRIRAATLATFTPERDEGEATLRVGLRTIQLLGEYAARIARPDEADHERRGARR